MVKTAVRVTNYQAIFEPEIRLPYRAGRSQSVPVLTQNKRIFTAHFGELDKLAIRLCSGLLGSSRCTSAGIR